MTPQEKAKDLLDKMNGQDITEELDKISYYSKKDLQRKVEIVINEITQELKQMPNIDRKNYLSYWYLVKIFVRVKLFGEKEIIKCLNGLKS